MKNQDLIAICMATYNPPPRLFARQIQSIKEQSYAHWICLISDDHSSAHSLENIKNVIGDDKRFILYNNQSEQGFYYNFENSLSKVPKSISFIALADQDDYWYPDKLEILLSRFDENTTLVYSDLNVVTENREIIADTFWTKWGNQYEDLSVMLLANTITGAAAMFRRDLLPYLLPFPPKIGESFHDHWIACVALALGNIQYINRQLYDYVQHRSNVNGAYIPWSGRMAKLRKWAMWLSPLTGPRKIGYWYHSTTNALKRGQLFAQTIAQRCLPEMDLEKKQQLLKISGDGFAKFPWQRVRVPNPPLYYRGILEVCLSPVRKACARWQHL